jgi:hypothetical protein
MKGGFLFPWHIRLYVVENRSFGDEPHLIGIFTTLDKAVQAYDLFDNKRRLPYVEGDMLSIYTVDYNKILWEGLEGQVVWHNQWGTFYANDSERLRVETALQKLKQKGGRLISL